METMMAGFDTHFVAQQQASSDSDSDSDSSDGGPAASAAAPDDSDSDASPYAASAAAAGADDDDGDDDDDDSDSSEPDQAAAAASFDEAAHAPRKGAGWSSFDIPDEFKRRSGRERKQTSTYTVAAESPTPRGRAAAKRGRAKGKAKQSYDSDESEDSSSEDSDDYAPKKKRRGAKGKQKPARARGTGRSNAVQSYNEDSDMDEDERAYEREQKLKKSKLQAAVEDPDVELQAGDIIDKVLDHKYWSRLQEGVINIETDGRTAALVLGPEIPKNMVDTTSGTDHLMFLVKWKGWSHIHNTWNSMEDLSKYHGYKKLQTYLKKLDEQEEVYAMWPEEEQEAFDAERTMELELLESHVNVERICAHREAVRDGGGHTEFFAKWEGLNYDEATWEGIDDIATRMNNPFDVPSKQMPIQDKIDEYHKRKEHFVKPKDRYSAFSNPARRVQRDTVRKYDKQPEWLQNGELRAYQLEGINWLYMQWCKNTNTILADEMGLGKTLQTVSFLSILFYQRKIPGPFLLVVPLITVDAWRREFAKWVPDMNVIVYVGNKAARQRVEEYEFYHLGTHGVRTRTPAFHVLITTYDMILADSTVLKQFQWEFLAIDEAHRLKNQDSKLYQVLNDFTTANRLLITGTPLQNDMQELWTLLHFLEPTKFDDSEDFEEQYGNLSGDGAERVMQLHKTLKPHLLRREKKDAEKALPPKSYRVVRISNSPMQKKFYKDVLSKNFAELHRGVKGKKPSLLNIVLELKKVCNHPYLFESSGYQGRIVDMSPRSMSRARANAESRKEAIIRSSGKMIFLEKILAQLRATGHRVLIFSQMVRVLNILEDYLKLKGYPFQRIDGSTPKQKRFQSMDHYNEPGSKDFVFLLSTRAGGLGINLATADTVIIYDSDWNPQNDLQAESRAHRIGQKLPVIVYRLVAKQTVEEDILARAKAKLVQSELVISGMDTGAKTGKGAVSSKFDAKELNSILQFGASELFKKGDNEEEDEAKAVESIASEIDMDDLLARPSYETAKNEETPGEGGSALMSSFNTVDFDENFWEKTIAAEDQEKAKELEEQEKLKDIVEHDRKREKVSYNEDEAFGGGGGGGDDDDSDDDIFEDGLKGRKQKEDLGKGLGRCLNAAQKKQFVHAFRKFAMTERIDSILKDAELEVDSDGREELVKMADELLSECKRRKQKMEAEASRPTASPVEGEPAPAKEAPPTSNTVPFCGLKVSVKDLIMRRKDMQFLKKHVETTSAAEAAKKGQPPEKGDPLAPDFDPLLYRMRLKSSGQSMNPVGKALSQVQWTEATDAMILLATHIYGWSSFDKARADPRMSILESKIPPDSMRDIAMGASKLPKKEVVLKRVTSLIKALKGQEKQEKMRRRIAANGGPSPPGRSNSDPTKKVRVPLSTHFSCSLSFSLSFFCL
jgi:chromodomain-helicase-DNA-binding protein 1